jgi:hypothetical protein
MESHSMSECHVRLCRFTGDGRVAILSFVEEHKSPADIFDLWPTTARLQGSCWMLISLNCPLFSNGQFGQKVYFSPFTVMNFLLEKCNLFRTFVAIKKQ